MNKLLARTLVIFVLAWGGACSRPAAPPKAAVAQPKPPPPAPPSADEDGLAVSGVLGTLDQDAIQRGVATRFSRAADCFQRQARQRPYLAGSISLEFRVATDGRTKRLRIVESTVGSWDVERCVQSELQATVFDRPRGGEAEFTYPLSFDGRVDATLWDPGMVRDELTESRDALLGLAPKKPKRKGKRGKIRQPPPSSSAGVELVAPEGLILTFYVDWRGQVVSAGLAAAEPIDEDFATRFLANLSAVRFPGATGAKYAKVIYRW
jgi:hypothetical protein